MQILHLGFYDGLREYVGARHARTNQESLSMPGSPKFCEAKFALSVLLIKLREKSKGFLFLYFQTTI